MQIFDDFETDGNLIKSDERYDIHDNTLLSDLTVSRTALHPGHSTGGHHHDDQGEIYIFTQGEGEIELGSISGDRQMFPVKSGTIVYVEPLEYHKVHNSTGTTDLVFISIFNKRTHNTGSALSSKSENLVDV